MSAADEHQQQSDKHRRMRHLRIRLMRLAFVPFVFVAIFGWRSWPDDSMPELLLESIGYVFLMVGVALRLWATLHIGGHKSTELITDGPFSMCRNPLYVGTMLLAIGASLCLENILLLAMTVLFLVPIHAAMIISEERHLAEIFGAPFEAYRSRVPRFLFRFRNFHERESLVISTKMLKHAIAGSAVAVLIPLMEDVLQMLHNKGMIPVLWKLF